MTAQEYIVLLIGIIALGILAKRITRLFAKKSSPCNGCTGCGLTNEKNKC